MTNTQYLEDRDNSGRKWCNKGGSMCDHINREHQFKSKFILVLLLTHFWFSACAQEETNQQQAKGGRLNLQVNLATQQKEVIYGDDSRLEFYELANPDIMKQRVINSTGLLLRPSKVNVQGQRVLLDQGSLGERQNLCLDERFYSQPEPGHCSGTLIDSDLFLTAGHCVDDEDDCSNTRIVFVA